nr:rhomboid family intramembrane serine protease [Conexibacter arvalis]
MPLKDNLGTDRLPVVTLLLIVANVAVYLLIQGGGIAHGPSEVETVGYASAVPSLFLHAGLLHLLANMLALWLFGPAVEDSMSRWRYLLLYLAGGLAAIALQVALDPHATVPALGASGAVAAVLGGCLLLYPRVRFVSIVFVPLFSTLVELPAWVPVAAWVAVQAIVGATALSDVADASGAVAAVAPVGGLLVGLLAVKLLADRRKQVPVRVKVAA